MSRRDDIQAPEPRNTEENSTHDSRLTEQANPRTAAIDTAGTDRIVELLFAEDRTVADAVGRESSAIARLIDLVFDRMARGGRLVYVGAGTSGRLGVLDAAECPPTFGTPPDLVTGVIAGGYDALVRSREGAEDDREAGEEAMREAKVGPDDFVLGIAASGTTPYVHAALEWASASGAGTGFLSCTTPPPPVVEAVDVCVTPLTGPEAITGSTRLKAGTATKLVLNALTTAVMVRLGKVHGNLMVDLQARSEKLVERSLRILAEVAGVDRAVGGALLARSGGSVKTAIVMHAQGADRNLAERRLDSAGGFLRTALDRFAGEVPVRYYDIYSRDEAGGGRLLERLMAGPALVRAAVEHRARAGEAGDGVRHAWSPARHVQHLIACENGMIQPRLAAMAEAPEGPPPAFESWALARAHTLDLIRDSGDDLLDRRARLGDEEFSAWQFLRAMVQHEEAHATRITEWIHPSLVRPPLDHPPLAEGPA
jgi:N-acetylmuramic acid 6-phosphate etherase